MYIKCRGLIIKQTDSGEKGKILTILTENRGVVYAKATGGKNVGASYFRCVQLFTYCEFHFHSGYNPRVLTILDALYIRSFFELSKDVESFSLASYCAELCKISLVGGEEDKEVLKLLLNTFHTLEKEKYPLDHIKAVYETRLCVLLGFAPYLEECDCCGLSLPNEELATFFDIEQGCVRCEACVAKTESKGAVVQMPAAVYRSMLHTVICEKDALFKFRTDEETLCVFSAISEKNVLCRLEYEPKSLPLYKSFKQGF